MSKFDKKLKTHKEEFKTALSKMISATLNEHIDKVDADQIFDEHMPSMNKFCKKLKKYGKRYGFGEFNKWVRDTLNEIKLGDILYENDMDLLED